MISQVGNNTPVFFIKDPSQQLDSAVADWYDRNAEGEIINRQLCHFIRVDVQLGMGIAKGLGVDVESAMPKDGKH